MNKKVKIVLLVVIIILLIITTAGVGIGIYFWNKNGGSTIITGKKDDWVYTGPKKESENWLTGSLFGGYNSKTTSSIQSISSAGASYDSINAESSAFNAKSDSTLGYSVGGSKNITNFRENIKNGYFPISTDITYNGLFYDYYFDTGKYKESSELFSPSYSMAISKDPISNQNEYYMTVGLNSNIKMSDFKRKKQNLMIVLDISGSMSSSLNSYYYDENEENEENEREYKSKMQLANESVNLLIDQLKDDDRFGIVLFDDEAYLAKPMNLVKETDIEKIKKHVLDITDNGGTNFEAGYTKATESFSKELLNDSEYDNRIIVITDAMPNLGTTSKTGLSKYVKDNAEKKIYTSFVGVGVDFNTDVIETLSNVKGANYYSVSSSEQFKKILGEDFEYMVTPLVFDLNLNFKSDSYEIEEIYGTDNKDKTKGNIISVNTLFPSSTNSSSGTKGGVILLKLKKKNNESDGKIKLSVSYSDRDNKKYSNEDEISFVNNNEFYANTGIRKAIVLVRYVNTLKNWILYERTQKDEFIITDETGITDCIYTKDNSYRMLGINERTSVNLKVSEKYKEVFSKLREYIIREKDEVKDDDLKQEIEILDKLIK